VSIKPQMRQLILIVQFAILANVFAENCDKLGILLYEELNCTPIYSNASTCPVKYECKDFGKLDSAKCYYKGKSYEIDEKIPDTKSRCLNDCRCVENAYSSEFAGIECPDLVCDYFAGISPNCTMTYSFSECCATGKICEPYENVARCNFNGKEYKEGQEFQPQDSCHNCICQKGFTGKIEEPVCRRRVCGVQLAWTAQILGKYWAPVYAKESKGGIVCCPSTYVGPDNSEVVTGDAKSDEFCRFGNTTIKVGQSFERTVTSHYKIQCECSIPPLLTCFKIKTTNDEDYDYEE
jgi:hypothetical protein